MSRNIVEKVVINMGFKNIPDFLIKYFLPLTISLISVVFILTFFLPIPILITAGIFGMGMLGLSVYPYLYYEQKKNNIDQNMHLFITFAGSISTIDIQRNILFREIADKELFGEISSISKKIVYLSKSWNLGFSSACRKMSVISPSRVLADFLDRFAVMMDFGQDLQTFLVDEQIAVLDDYSVEYKKSIERMKTLQDVFLAITMSMAFMITIGMLMPLLGSYNMNSMLWYAFGGIVFFDAGMVLFVYSLIPQDSLCHSLPEQSKEQKHIDMMLYATVPVTVFIMLFLSMFKFFPLLVNAAIAIIPLFFVGVQAQNVEELVYKRDKQFPTFIRTLGSGVEVRQGAILSSLYAFQAHDFGALNELSISLYRRLRTGNDKLRSWEFFGIESGSNLIVQFSHLFAEALALGSSGEKMGELISVNFQKLLSLRKLRLQVASTMRGSFYGALAGLASSGYVAIEITQILDKVLNKPTVVSADSDLSNILSGVASTQFQLNVEFIGMIVGLIIIVHAITCAIILKLIEGGNPYASLFDICIMIWMGAIFSIVVPMGVRKLLPELFSQVEIPT